MQREVNDKILHGKNASSPENIEYSNAIDRTVLHI